MTIRWSAVLLAVALAGAGCGPPDAAEPPARSEPGGPATAAQAETAADATAECTNPEGGYALRYPAGWRTNPGDVLPPCTLFDPDSIQVPRDSEIPIEIAVQVGVEPVPFGTAAGETPGRVELSRERVSVAGRPGVRILAETTGEGLYPAGIRLYEYLVDLNGSTLSAVTYEAGTPAFQRKQMALNAMMATLELRPGG